MTISGKTTIYSLVFALVLQGVLATAITTSSSAAPRAQQAPSGTAASTKVLEFKQQILAWGVNRNVRVQLQSKEKLRGRVTDIRDEAFVLQIVDKDKITTREIGFQDLKSLKAWNESRVAERVAFGIIGGLAALGTLVLIALSQWD